MASVGMLQVSLKFKKKKCLDKTEPEVEPAELEPEEVSYHHYICWPPNLMNWSPGKLVGTQPSRDNLNRLAHVMLSRALLCLYVQKCKPCKSVA